MKSILLFSSLFFFYLQAANAQCAEGEVAITMNISVDGWGEEGYWEIVPEGYGCGTGTMAFGGNSDVGCAGNDPNGDGGYPDGTIVSEGPICLVLGQTYDLIYIDSYGDGGLNFEVYENGNYSHNFIGGGDGNIWTFEAGNNGLATNDSPCGAFEVIVDGAATEMTNTNAIAQGNEPHPAGGGCGTYGFWCDSDPNVTNSVWAYFVAEEGVSYDITTCNENPGFDTQIALYHAQSCDDFSSFELISSNDDMPGGCGISNGYSSRMFASCLTPGEFYYIQVDGWGGSLGTSLLTVSTYNGDVNMYADVQNIICPLGKSEVPYASILPFLEGEGENFTTVWSGPNNYSSNENYQYNLNPGTYNVTLTSACGEVFTNEYQITQPASWNVFGTGTGPDCIASGNGSIMLSVSGATSPYTYTWQGPDNFLSQQEDLTGLDFGSYQLNITDNNECVWNQTFQLNPLNSFQFELGADTTICIDDDLIVVGPVGLAYSWQDGSTNQFFLIQGEEWGPGPHALILTATTDEGCSFSDAFLFTIEQCSSVSGIDIENGFSIYPNPSKGSVMINRGKANGLVDIRLYDSSARLVHTQTNSGNLIPLDVHLPEGAYMLDVNDNGVHFRKQMIIID